ncbi:MAG TPA: hypothetical protein VJW94_14590 [Candidatus Acidoferrum sp.]|nr:hypothetical protein [Candidatus Acidoferrum sp.]
MSVSVRFADDYQTSQSGYQSEMFIPANYGAGPQPGDTLIVLLAGGAANTEVTSITDSDNNTYKQLPEAFVSSTSGGMNNAGFFLDIWYAENITHTSGTPVTITVNCSGTVNSSAQLGVALIDAVGTVGGSKLAATSVTAANTNPANGPSLAGGASQSVYVTAICGFAAGEFYNSAVNSPWSTGNVYPDLPLTEFAPDCAMAYMIGTGTQQVSWTLQTSGLPAGFTGAIFGPASSGGNGGGGNGGGGNGGGGNRNYQNGVPEPATGVSSLYSTTQAAVLAAAGIAPGVNNGGSAPSLVPIQMNKTGKVINVDWQIALDRILNGDATLV